MIAFHYNNKVLVRRVVCEGGKQLTIDSDGTVFVNGTALEEPYAKTAALGNVTWTSPATSHRVMSL